MKGSLLITAPTAARLCAPSPRLSPPAPPRLRSAHRGDATALEALSRPFVRSGALRERSLALYASDAADFLVVEAQDGTFDACLGLRVHPAEPSRGRGPTGVLYNFCVAPHTQGLGLGARLLRGALAHATAQSLDAVFTATTGGGGLFLRYGFGPVSPDLAPTAWAKSLDPRRNSQVLTRTL